MEARIKMNINYGCRSLWKAILDNEVNTVGYGQAGQEFTQKHMDEIEELKGFYINDIQQSTKFHIDISRIMIEGRLNPMLMESAEVFYKNGLLKLPYDSMAVEFHNAQDFGVNGFICFMNFDKESQKILFTFAIKKDRWVLCPEARAIPKPNTLKQDGGCIVVEEITLPLGEITEKTSKTMGDITGHAVAFLSLLGSKSVSITEHRPTKHPKSKRFQELNNQSLYDCNIIDIFATTSDGRIVREGNKHASPVAHWRRGHIRHMAKKNIWIAPILVMGAGQPVKKEYRA
jgi:hypothetical protein